MTAQNVIAFLLFLMEFVLNVKMLKAIYSLSILKEKEITAEKFVVRGELSLIKLNAMMVTVLTGMAAVTNVR